MIIFSVDYGDARTGTAVCDKGEMLASPVGVITEYHFDRLVEKLSAAAQQHRAERIVVGNPINMDGTRGTRSEAAAKLADALQQASGIEVVLWDERQTTISAAGFLNEVNVRGKKRKAVIDAVAAVIILENYLAFRKNNP